MAQSPIVSLLNPLGRGHPATGARG